MWLCPSSIHFNSVHAINCVPFLHRRPNHGLVPGHEYTWIHSEEPAFLLPFPLPTNLSIQQIISRAPSLSLNLSCLPHFRPGGVMRRMAGGSLGWGDRKHIHSGQIRRSFSPPPPLPQGLEEEISNKLGGSMTFLVARYHAGYVTRLLSVSRLFHWDKTAIIAFLSLFFHLSCPTTYQICHTDKWDIAGHISLGKSKTKLYMKNIFLQ